MRTNYVLVDYENVPVKSLALLKGEHFRVVVFLGKNNTKVHSELAVAMQALGNRAEYVQLESSGANALDFHIAYYVGRIVASDPMAAVNIVSKDTGFDPLLQHLKTKEIEAARSVSIEQLPCFVPAHRMSAQPSSAPMAETAAASTKAKASSKKRSADLEACVKIAVADLIARKSKQPKKMQTLLNTIHNRIGMERPVADAVAVRDELVARKYVVSDGLKVTYKLPKWA